MFNLLSKNQSYYAKKGEPIYQKDMDYDEDGVVSLDEFQKYCKENDFGPKDQEYLITDPIIEHIKVSKKIHVVPIRGEYLDGGSTEGWLHANNVICGE